MTENLENFLMDLIKGQVSVRAISRVQARRRFMSVVGRSIVVRAFRCCSRRSPFDLRPRVPAFHPPGGGVGPRVVVASTARCAYSPVSRATSYIRRCARLGRRRRRPRSTHSIGSDSSTASSSSGGASSGQDLRARAVLVLFQFVRTRARGWCWVAPPARAGRVLPAF